MIHYTTIEQSKKLVELGLNPDTADMAIVKDNTYCNALSAFNGVTLCQNYNEIKDKTNYIPCWSLGALLELMPKEKELPFKDSNAFVGYGDNYYRCVYLNGNWESSHQEVGNSYMEATYNMVVWLVENGYIKTK